MPPGSGFGGMTQRSRDILQLPAPDADERIPYSDPPLRFGELRLPAGAGPHPLAVVIHGGFWRAAYNLDHIGHLCAALGEVGVATWSLEYRRIGDDGGGWPGTFADVAAGADFVRELSLSQSIDPERVVSVGHSAGGHLALWLASRANLAGSGPVATRSQSAASRLWQASPTCIAPGISSSASVVGDLLGGSPEEVPDRYRLASPIASPWRSDSVCCTELLTTSFHPSSVRATPRELGAIPSHRPSGSLRADRSPHRGLAAGQRRDPGSSGLPAFSLVRSGTPDRVRFPIRGVASLAGVTDLHRAWDLQLSNSVVGDLLGGSPEEVPDRYRLASPIENLPLEVRQRLLHGTLDDIVPPELSASYAARAQAEGDDAQYLPIDRAGHFELIDPRTEAWQRVSGAILDLLN